MCTFCQIVTGELGAHLVYDDESFVAFFDLRPIFPGHTLLVPRAHHETLPDLPGDLLGPFFTVAQRLAVAIPEERPQEITRKIGQGLVVDSRYQQRVTGKDRTEIEEGYERVVVVDEVGIELAGHDLTEGAHVAAP